MFARSAFRVMQPMRMHARRYTTEHSSSPSSAISAISSTTTSVLVAVGALAAGGLGYTYFSKTPTADAAKSKAFDLKSAAAAAGLAAKPAFTGGDQGFLSLVLDKVETVNHNTKKFTFKLPEEDMVSGMHVASALLTKYIGPEMAKPVVRAYTPISDEDTPGEITLLVKKYTDGPMSTHLHSMQPGQRLDFKGPLAKYSWTPNKHTHVGLVAGGTGITPMFQLVRCILKNPDDRTKVTLIFGNISEDDILLRTEIDKLENTYPQRFRVFHTLDKPASSWPGTSGRISKELLKTVLPEPKEEGIKLFVCGPPGLMKAVSGEKVSPRDQGDLSGLLKDLGYAKEQVFKF